MSGKNMLTAWAVVGLGILVLGIGIGLLVSIAMPDPENMVRSAKSLILVGLVMAWIAMSILAHTYKKELESTERNSDSE